MVAFNPGFEHLKSSVLVSVYVVRVDPMSPSIIAAFSMGTVLILILVVLTVSFLIVYLLYKSKKSGGGHTYDDVPNNYELSISSGTQVLSSQHRCEPLESCRNFTNGTSNQSVAATDGSQLEPPSYEELFV